jgi:hypothetical protein
MQDDVRRNEEIPTHGDDVPTVNPRRDRRLVSAADRQHIVRVH